MKKLLIALLLLTVSFSSFAQIIPTVKPTRIFPSYNTNGNSQYLIVNDSTEAVHYAFTELKYIKANADYITVNIGGHLTSYKPAQFLDERWIPYHPTNAKLAYFNYLTRWVYSASSNYNY